MTRLEVGQPAPSWTLTDHTGTIRSLADWHGQRLIVFCYPAAMTPGCTKEACDFRDSLEPLRQNGYDVVGISPDTPEKLAQFVEKEALTYPLLADPDHRTLSTWGAYGEKKLYGKTVTGVIRSTIVVDETGGVAVAKYNVRATGHVAALRKTLGV
ncbi:MAG: peroxiredoxin [Actinomycetota bacterium]